MTVHTPAIWPHQNKTLNAVLGALWLGDHLYVLEQHPSLIFAPFALCHVYEHCLICSQSLWGFTFTDKACRWVTAHKHRLLQGHIKTGCNLLTVNHLHGSILSYFSWQTWAGFQNLDIEKCARHDIYPAGEFIEMFIGLCGADDVFPSFITLKLKCGSVDLITL